ncbi:ImmA/IrrE family metallo-endopeptidase (plasmid) [Jeotgalibaca porci]|uniref:ImmA/IrrE family metallo-endopeptidase n=1 Tax=Jeotgalibaca porci TaxID=1868793 RepID=A0A6G7WKL6_9LACT|nr:DUF6782 family putative metallopeptidase [Jeotgalibaca porci]QIK52782.1 ImmA/IrrE family metallo-endopeptidase [Jeotgalibaca porci]
MAYNYKKKTAEERKLEIDSLTDEMHVNLRNYATDPKELEAFLVFMSQFYNYSLKNQLLIHSQFKGAFGVASFKTFKDWGFSVLKGEKGIKIFVPVEIKQFKTKQGTWKNLSAATKEEKEDLAAHKTTVETRKRVSFKLGTVFDVTQTNAQPEDYPDLFPNRKKDFQYAGKQMVILKKTLLRYAKEEQIGVQTAKISNSPAKGYYRPDTHAIVLSDRNNESESIHTLIHELAHAAMHHPKKMAQKETALQETPVLEYQAEMTAYVVAHAFGLDTKAHSLQYTAQWTKNLEHVTELEKALEEVKSVSSELISRLEKLLENERLNMHAGLKDAPEAKNNGIGHALFSIHTIEPIAKIGTHMVYDLELHSETTEPQFYRILTTKTPVEIGQTWKGEKSGADWLKENTLTAFVEKHPEITSPQEKIANIEKDFPAGPELLDTYVAKERSEGINSGLSL